MLNVPFWKETKDAVKSFGPPLNQKKINAIAQLARELSRSLSILSDPERLCPGSSPVEKESKMLMAVARTYEENGGSAAGCFSELIGKLEAVFGNKAFEPPPNDPAWNPTGKYWFKLQAKGHWEKDPRGLRESMSNLREKLLGIGKELYQVRLLGEMIPAEARRAEGEPPAKPAGKAKRGGQAPKLSDVERARRLKDGYQPYKGERRALLFLNEWGEEECENGRPMKDVGPHTVRKFLIRKGCLIDGQTLLVPKGIKISAVKEPAVPPNLAPTAHQPRT